MTTVPEHTSRIEAILKLSGHPNVRIADFRKMLEMDLEHSVVAKLTIASLEKYLPKPQATAIVHHTSFWLSDSLFFAYDFQIRACDDIRETYLPKIGDIFLKFMEYYHRMKQKRQLKLRKALNLK